MGTDAGDSDNHNALASLIATLAALGIPTLASTLDWTLTDPTTRPFMTKILPVLLDSLSPPPLPVAPVDFEMPKQLAFQQRMLDKTTELAASNIQKLKIRSQQRFQTARDLDREIKTLLEMVSKTLDEINAQTKSNCTFLEHSEQDLELSNDCMTRHLTSSPLSSSISTGLN